jgi:hypothetical protein
MQRTLLSRALEVLCQNCVLAAKAQRELSRNPTPIQLNENFNYKKQTLLRSIVLRFV